MAKKPRKRKSRVPRPMNTITVRLAGIFDLNSGPGASDQFVNATLFTRSLKQAYRGTSVGPPIDLPLNNYDKFYSIFDLFRVTKVHIKYVPAYQFEVYDETGKQEILPPLIISHDVDNSINYDVKNQLGDAQTKMRDPTRPWKLSFTIPRPPGENVDVWQNCQADTAGRFDSGIISINSIKSVRPDSLVGTLYVTYECSFKERQDTNILPPV